MVYTLSLDSNFAPFLAEGATWGKKTRAQPLRGFTDDGEDVPQVNRQTAQQKVNFLELMLGQIANYCPIISRNTLVKNSTSIQFIWNVIREHFGFQITGAHFLDFASLRLNPDECPEDLYQRITAFVEDSLLSANGLYHHGEQLEEDEEISPTVENLIVFTWLRLINPELPKLMKQRYGTELRSRTLAPIKPEISQALTSLLEEIHSADDAKIMRTAVSNYRMPDNSRSSFRPSPKVNRSVKCCPLCKQAGRASSNHFLSQCSFLPEQDRKYMVKARQIAEIFDDTPEIECSVKESVVNYNPEDEDPKVASRVFRVQTRQSPYLDMFYSHHPVRITIDSGATGNMIRHSIVKSLGCNVTTSSQSVHQADGSSPLHVVGETRLVLHRDGKEFIFEGLVVENFDVDVLAGTPFMGKNDIAVRPAKRHVILGNGSTYIYGLKSPSTASTAARRAPPKSTTVWPGEFIELDLLDDLLPDAEYALEPRIDAPCAKRVTTSQLWPPPNIVTSVAGRVRIPNLATELRFLKRNEHFCQVRPVYIPDVTSESPLPDAPIRSQTKLKCIHRMLVSIRTTYFHKISEGRLVCYWNRLMYVCKTLFKHASLDNYLQLISTRGVTQIKYINTHKITRKK